MYVHINLNISTYVNVPHMYAYMCISFLNISTFVDVPHMCIYVHINLNLSTYVDVPHMCVYMWINATKRTRSWTSQEIFLWNSMSWHWTAPSFTVLGTEHSVDIPKECMMLHTALPEVFAGSFASSFEKERGFVTLREMGREHRLLAVTLSGGQPFSREQKSGRAEVNAHARTHTHHYFWKAALKITFHCLQLWNITSI